MKSLKFTALAAVVGMQCFGQTPTAPVPCEFFGMHVQFSGTPWPTVSVGAQGKANGIQWPYIERSKGVRDWSLLDANVTRAAAHGVSFMQTAKWVPPWAASNDASCIANYAWGATVCSSGVTNIQDWKDFMTALVTRYKGRIAVYELWNEPSDIAAWSGTMAELVAMCNAERDVIRAIDPAALVIGPAMQAYASAFLDSYFTAGGAKDIDAVTMHASPNPTNAFAEFVLGSVTKDIRAVMLKHGLASKPLWNTETDWTINSAPAVATDDQRAAFIARTFLLNWSLGISRAYWYAWDNSQIGTMWSAATGPLSTSVAYQQIYNWMVGATMPLPCAWTGTDFYHALYTCDLTRPNGYQARAVWKTDEPASYVAPSQFTSYRDLTGARFPIINHQVTVGPKPILLETAALATNLNGGADLTITGPSTSGAGLIGAVVNGASFTPGPAPGSVSTIFGSNLAVAACNAAAVPLPTSLGGVSVTINRTAAPLWYVGPQQINFEMPAEVAPGPAMAIVTIDGAATVPFSFTVAQAAPGIFAFGNNRAVVTNRNGSLADAGHPATPGSVITVYLTGLGPLDHSVPTNAPSPAQPLSRAMMPASATIGKMNAPIQFLGLTPGRIALAQANIRVPNLSPGDYPVVITIGVASNAPLVAVGHQ